MAVKSYSVMTSEEIERFLTCSRVGRLGVFLEDNVYVFPMGYVYKDGKIIFHSCDKGTKMNAMKKNSNVCFEVDESVSDITMYKSVMVFGNVEIISKKEEMIPYLQILIDKYRMPQSFDSYMKNRDTEAELKVTRICVIHPTKITGVLFIREHKIL